MHLTLKHRAVDPAVSSLESGVWKQSGGALGPAISRGSYRVVARDRHRIWGRLDLSRVECLRSRSSVWLGCWNVLLGCSCCAPDAVSVPVSGDPFHRPSAIAMVERELRWRCHARARARARAELPLVRCLLWVEITLRCSGWDPGFRTGTPMQPMQPTHPTQPRNLLASWPKQPLAARAGQPSSPAALCRRCSPWASAQLGKAGQAAQVICRFPQECEFACSCSCSCSLHSLAHHAKLSSNPQGLNSCSTPSILILVRRRLCTE